MGEWTACTCVASHTRDLSIQALVDQQDARGSADGLAPLTLHGNGPAPYPASSAPVRVNGSSSADLSTSTESVKRRRVTPGRTRAPREEATTEDESVRIAAEALENLSQENPRIEAKGVDGAVEQNQFIDRMLHYPFVSSAVKAYEHSKSYSRGFKYGAEMMESVAKPVVRRFEPLDSFARRQLDRFERKHAEPADVQAITVKEQTEAERQGRWQNMLVGAGSFGIAMSDESLKCLRYALEWLQWANSNIANLVRAIYLILPSDGSAAIVHHTQQEQEIMQRLTQIKSEIIDTVRQAVDVLSKYTANALPEPARASVRSYVLTLPSRWAHTTEMDKNQKSADDPRVSGSRLISFARESLEMLQGVGIIVDDTLRRAEDWCDRLGRNQNGPQWDQEMS